MKRECLIKVNGKTLYAKATGGAIKQMDECKVIAEITDENRAACMAFVDSIEDTGEVHFVKSK